MTTSLLAADRLFARSPDAAPAWRHPGEETPNAKAVPIHARTLSKREREVLSLVAEGNSNKLISAHLDISDRTVKNHLTNIMTKLRAYDRTHAVVTAVRLGWLAI